MADKWLLESGPPDAWQLEDGTGVWLIDAPAAAFVQEVAAYTTGTSGNPDVVAITAAPATGNHLVVVAVKAGGRTLTSVTDSQGNTWQIDETLANTTNHGIGIASCRVVNPLTTSDTISLTWSSTGVAAAVVNEYIGLDPTAWVDLSVSSPQVSQTPVESGLTGTTNQADELLVGGVAHAGTSGFTPDVEAPVWNTRGTQAASGTVRTIRSFDRVVTSTGDYEMAGDLAGAQVNTGAIVTYKVAAGGETVSPAAIALALGLVAPARVDQEVSPGAIALATAPVDPSVAQSLDAGAIALSLATLAPDHLDATVDPAGVALALTAVAPRTDLEVAAGAIALALATPAPSVDQAVTPAAIDVVVAVLAWDRMDADASPVAIPLSVTALAPEVANVLTPDPLALAIAAVGPRLDLDMSPGAIALVVSPQAPTRLDFEVAPDAQGVTLTPVAPSRTDQDATMTAVALTLALPAPTVNLAGAETVAPDPLALSLDVPAPRADLEAGVAAVGLSLATPAPALAAELVPDPLVLTITAVAPRTDLDVAPGILTIVLDAQVPVSIEQNVLADAIAIALALLAPELTNEGGVVTGSLRMVSVRLVMPAGGMTSVRPSMGPGPGPLPTERNTRLE